MAPQVKIVIMVLITLTMGQAKEDMDIMKEMIAGMKMEMNERLSLAEGKTEADLAATKDELAATKDDLAATKDDLAATKDDLASTRDDLAVTKDALAKAITDHAEALTSLATKDDLAILKASPYIHACGSHFGRLPASSGTIAYNSLLYSSTNQEDGGLDITTGVFTAPCGGSYTVSWDTSVELGHGEEVNILLQRNGDNIRESEHISAYYGNDHVYEQGGRTLVVHLDLGDTLQLYMEGYHPGGNGNIHRTIFCVSLTTVDIV